jgi:putative RecB family exonuclease
MALDLPRTLTPSKVVAFTNCPLAFRYSVIEHRPEPPSPHAVKGTLVHSALEGLFWNHAPAGRTRAAAGHELARAWAELGSDPEFIELGLGNDEAAAFLADADTLVDNYFRLEDPTTVHTIGVELGVEIENDGLRLRGIIDRLDMAPDGALTVVDYKTGRAPSERYERCCARRCSDGRPSRYASCTCATRSPSPPSPRPRPCAGNSAAHRPCGTPLSGLA